MTVASPIGQGGTPGEQSIEPSAVLETVGVAAMPARHRQSKQANKGRSNADQLPIAQQILIYALLSIGSLAFLIPFYFVVNASFKNAAAVQSGDFITPPRHASDVRWSNYKIALGPDRMNFTPALANTVVITTLCVIGQVLSCSLVGFGFARFQFRGRSLLFMVMLSTMMLPAQVTMIPVFVLFRMLHMIDTLWPLIIPAWLASPFFVFMFRQFFAANPRRIDRSRSHRRCGKFPRVLANHDAPLRAGDGDRGHLHVPWRVE